MYAGINCDFPHNSTEDLEIKYNVVFYTLINHSSILRSIHKSTGRSWLLMMILQTLKSFSKGIQKYLYRERFQCVLLIQTCATIMSSPSEPEPFQITSTLS